MCGVVCVKIMTRLLSAVIMVLLVELVVVMIGWYWFVFGLWWLDWEMKERPRELYPNQKRRLYDTILTSAYMLIIHKTAYSILIILIIYQVKKIG